LLKKTLKKAKCTIKVKSSNVRNISYDEDTRILEVEFHSGGVYHYSEVTPDVYAAFESASSKGTFLYENIKGIYDYEKIA
jgi:hypothetical protein